MLTCGASAGADSNVRRRPATMGGDQDSGDVQGGGQKSEGDCGNDRDRHPSISNALTMTC